MKNKKTLIFTFLLLALISSCTDDDENYQTDTIEDIQATGDEDGNVNDGSKD
jgi:hypothetical protein